MRAFDSASLRIGVMSTTPASRFLGPFRLGGFRFARFAFAGFRLAEAFCFFADLRADAFRAMLVSLLATFRCRNDGG
jgi:hypothetical protein